MAMLKQSTAYNRMILMVGSADHVTGLAAATLTITASKNGAAFASITPTVTDRGSGFYNLAFTTAHTDTLGDLAIHITATSADPTDFVDQVIAADFGVANLAANVTQFGGAAGTFASGRPEVNTTHFGGTIAPTPNTPGIPMVDGRQTVYSGALAAATGTTVTLPAGASAVDNFYNDCFVIITGGTGNDQARAITGYVGSTKVATVDRAFATTPAAADTFIIYAFARTNTYAVAGTTQTARDLGAQLDATVSSRMATFTLPTNFSAFSLTAAGRVDVGAVSGTTQTARDLGLNIDTTISSRLAPTVASRTLDVSATGEAGIDWANIGSPTTTVNFSGTTISTTQAVASVSGAVGSVTGNVGGNVTGSVGSIVAGGLDTADRRVVRKNTLQAGTGSSATLDTGANANDDFYSGLFIVILNGTGAGQVRRVDSYVGATKVATVGKAWTVAPGAADYALLAFARVDVGSVQGTTQTARDLGANLDAAVSTRLATAGYTAPDNASITGIKTKTDFLPSATAGATGGVLIAGTNASATFTSGITSNITGNLSGSVGSVTGAVGSVTGAVGSVTATVSANLTQILGTALTETAGQIAAAFKQFFNVASPTGTVNSIPNAIAGATGGLLIAGTNASASFTSGITANITGNLSGSVGSVTGAVASVSGNVGGSVASVTGAVGSVTGNVGGNVSGSVASVTGAVGSVTGNVGGNVTGSVGSVAAGGLDLADRKVLRKNTLQAGTGTSFTLDTGANATNDFYTDTFIVILSGTGAGQVRKIEAYVGATKVGTVRAWTVNPGVADFAILAYDTAPISGIKTKTDFLPAATAGATGGVLIAGSNAATSFSSFTGNITGNLSGSVGSVTARVTANVDQIDGSGPAATQISNSVFNTVVENSKTFIQLTRGAIAALLGKSTGMGTSTVNFRDNADSKNRITATVDNSGNRTAISTDLT